MSRVKADLSQLSLNQLCELTGKTYRTVKKALDGSQIQPARIESGTLYYDPPDALAVIYAPPAWAEDPAGLEGDGDTSGQPRLDPIYQKARLDKLRADKVELEVLVMKGKLIPAEKVEETWTKMAGAFRAKILAVSPKVTPKIVAAGGSLIEIERILKQEHNEALAELAGYDSRASASREDS